MKRELVEGCRLEAVTHIDVKTTGKGGKITSLAVRMEDSISQELLCGLVALKSEQLKSLVLPSPNFRSTFTLSHDSSADHNNVYASFSDEFRSVAATMVIRTLSLTHWIDKLSYAYCSELPYETPDKRYISPDAPELTISMYRWSS